MIKMNAAETTIIAALDSAPVTAKCWLGICDDDFNLDGGLFDAARSIEFEDGHVVISSHGSTDLTCGDIVRALAGYSGDVYMRVGEVIILVEEPDVGDGWVQLTGWTDIASTIG